MEVGDLTGNPETSWLRPAALRYYLPAFMVRALENPVALDCFVLSVVHELSPPRAQASGRYLERLGGFSREQARAILGFLRVLEAKERAAWSEPEWPAEAVASVPVDRVLARAIRYWSGAA